MQRGSRRVVRRTLAVSMALIGYGFGISSASALGDSDKEAVRQLSNEAAADFSAGRYDSARDKFTRAYEVARVPRLAVWVARSYERAGRLVSAYELYRQAVRLEKNELWVGDTQEQAQRDAENYLAALVPRLPKLKIEVHGAPVNETEVRIDDSSVPTALLGIDRFVDPGKHEITATANGKVIREIVTVAEGARITVPLRFDSAAVPVARPVTATSPAEKQQAHLASTTVADPKNSGSAQRTWGWVAVGIGSAGILTGLGAGALVVSKHSALERDCPNGSCGPEQESRLDSYRTMRMVSTIGFVVGGIGAATGVTLLLLAPKANAASTGVKSVALWATPGIAGIRGTF